MRSLILRLRRPLNRNLVRPAGYVYLYRLKRRNYTTMNSESYMVKSEGDEIQDDVKTCDSEALPKLSASEFRIYNRMAEHMDYFHTNFRTTWNVLYSAATSGKRPSGMSIRQFIALGEQFCHHLTLHHTIEEQHIFPVLAKKMDAFREELELLTHHKLIHIGLEKLEKYLEDCKFGETELRLSQLKDIMDSFGAVLWEHLDAEVKQLGAENMRKYWSIKEMQRMPM